jgi:hypothetical protein
LRDRLHQRSQPGAHFEQSHQVVFANIQKGQLIGAGAKAAGNDTGLAIESIRGLRRPVLRLNGSVPGSRQGHLLEMRTALWVQVITPYLMPRSKSRTGWTSPFAINSVGVFSPRC